MTLHFERTELESRVVRARQALKAEGLDALLVFAQESHYYLTGFDTNGYVFFQVSVLTAADTPFTLLTRRPDLEQARRTSTYSDIRLWYDAEGANPARDLKAILEEKGLKGAKIGIELNTYGLTGFNHERVRRELEGWCTLVDGSMIVRKLRSVKSPAEITYVRRAAALADDAFRAMLAESKPGAFEGVIAGAGSKVIFDGGGDPPPSGPVLGSGDRALLVRSATGFRHLDPVDQLTMEFAASYRRYCACFMRTVAVGKANADQRAMFDATRDAIAAMTEAAKPGRPLGEIDDAHRRVYDKAGYAKVRMSACGYSLGATYRPNWMDVPPMLYSGNPWPAEAGMVLFMHAILIDPEKNLAMSAGHTVLVTATGREVLSKVPVEYHVCG